MNIYTYKAQFDQFMLRTDNSPTVEQAWEYFKELLRSNLDGGCSEDFGYKAGYASYSEFTGSFALDTHKVVQRIDKNVFRIYFGRTIDSKKLGDWSVAEIDFRFHYEINDELRFIAEENPNCYVEEFYDSAEDEENISRKKEAVLAFADEKRFIWDAIKGLKPVEREIYFQLE